MKYIYVISDGTDYKIGVANDPEKRLRQLQTGNKHTLSIVFSEQKNSAFKIEKHLHRVLDKYRIAGEWFSGITLRDIRIEMLLCTEHD